MTSSRANARTKLNLVLLIAFVAVTLLFGGASRADVISLPLVRLAAVLMIASAAIQLDREQWRKIRWPMVFLAVVAGLILLQLVPLPPGLWASLPGRERFAQGLALAGIPPVWRPASLTPDLTLNSLLAVLTPMATVMTLGLLDRSFHRLLLPLLLLGIAISAVVGFLQVYGGGPYFYVITNEGSAVGFFANRNHLALFIATGLPLVACWAALPHPDSAYQRLRFWIFLCAAAAIFPVLLVVGSRAGLIAGAVGCLTVFGFRRLDRKAGFDRRQWLILMIPVVIGAIAIGATFLMARDVALHRLLGGETDEVRSGNITIYLQIIRDFFPVGSGFGSFDPIYRSYEPVGTLSPVYLNHAHDDFAEIVIEAGIAGILIVLGFIGWFVVRATGLWLRRPNSPADLLGRAGAAVVLLLLIGSVVDYPLRTPAMAMIFAIACCWMRPGLTDDARVAAQNQRVGSPAPLG